MYSTRSTNIKKNNLELRVMFYPVSRIPFIYPKQEDQDEVNLFW